MRILGKPLKGLQCYVQIFAKISVFQICFSSMKEVKGRESKAAYVSLFVFNLFNFLY